MKLELKHLSPYLPYEIGIKYSGFATQYLRKDTLQLLDLVLNKQWKPILRPLSDLNKEIMLDLFKLVDESDYTDTLPLNFNDIEFQVDDEWNYVLQIGGALEFHTTGSTFGLFYQGEAFTIWNQLDLFNKMFEMHFDIFGLIEKGLAIDINTLKI